MSYQAKPVNNVPAAQNSIFPNKGIHRWVWRVRRNPSELTAARCRRQIGCLRVLHAGWVSAAQGRTGFTPHPDKLLCLVPAKFPVFLAIPFHPCYNKQKFENS